METDRDACPFHRNNAMRMPILQKKKKKKKKKAKETMHADCQTQCPASWGLLSPLFLSSLPLRNVCNTCYGSSSLTST
jgi:hypothetical protein